MKQSAQELQDVPLAEMEDRRTIQEIGSSGQYERHELPGSPGLRR